MRSQDTPRRMIRCEVGVPHRRRDIPMSLQFLNSPKVDTSAVSSALVKKVVYDRQFIGSPQNEIETWH